MEDIKSLLKEQEKRIEERIEEKIKRHIDVLKEDFDSKVALIAEQYDSIRETLDSHSEMIASIKEDIDIMKGDIEVMKGDITFIKNSLKKKVDVEEFEALERRVAILLYRNFYREQKRARAIYGESLLRAIPW
jgi:septal ring factor EnvC (AmiA/AmiB activator)